MAELAQTVLALMGRVDSYERQLDMILTMQMGTDRSHRKLADMTASTLHSRIEDVNATISKECALQAEIEDFTGGWTSSRTALTTKLTRLRTSTSALGAGWRQFGWR